MEMTVAAFSQTANAATVVNGRSYRVDSRPRCRVISLYYYGV